MDHLSIGPTPAGESCEQLGPSYSPENARKECARFIAGLRRYFGAEPPGAILHVHSNPHDFGTYLEVCVKYDENDERAADYAYALEGNAPDSWEALETGAPYGWDKVTS